MRLDFESFDINGLSDSAEAKDDADPKAPTECQDKFTITVSVLNILDCFIFIKLLMSIVLTFINVVSLFCSRQQRSILYLPFVEQTQANMVI